MRSKLRGRTGRQGRFAISPLNLGLVLAATATGLVGLVALGNTPDRPILAQDRPESRHQTRILYPSGRQPVLRLPNGQWRSISSLLNVRSPMQFGDHVWNDKDVPAGSVWIRIDLSRQIISVFRGAHEIGSAVILYGTDGKPTPTGAFHIIERAREHRSNLYDAEMPFMLRLTNDGVAIHASKVKEGSATHGCVGVPRDFAQLLFGVVKRGDLVVIEQGDSNSDPQVASRGTAVGRPSGAPSPYHT
jgi:hypothetical protein